MNNDRKIDAERESFNTPSEVDSHYGKIAPNSSKGSKPNLLAKSEIAGSSKDGVPPNGGFEAWLQVVGAFFLFMNSW